MHASRIDWFLGLRKTLTFPRYPLAPIAKLHALRKVKLDSAEAAASGAPGARAESVERWRPVVLPSIPTIGIFAPRPIIAGPDYLPGHQPTRLASQIRAGRAAVGAVEISGAGSGVRGSAQGTDAVPTRYVRQAQFPTGRTSLVVRLPDTSGAASPARTRFAPNGASRGLQVAAKASNESLAKPLVDGGHAGISDGDIRGFAAYHGVKDTFLVRTGSEAAETGEPAQGLGQQQRRSPAATLHIDGAALGRWTVQHLARILGKPTTGITGVDPRMTLPRGRVQPF
jgi:hypothetical protein